MTRPTTTIEHLDRGEWERLTPAFLDHNYQQTWAYARTVGERRRATVEHVAIMNAAAPIGLASVRVHELPIIGGGIACVRGGPLVRRKGLTPPFAAACFHVSIAVLRDEYSARRGLTLRMLAPPGGADWNRRLLSILAEEGFAATRGGRTYQTMRVDLDRPPATIRRSLHQKWRNALNAAERSGLRIRSGTDEALFEAFIPLHAETVRRKRFNIDLDARFYARVHAQLSPTEQFQVSLAEADGQPVAGHVASLAGDTCVYLLGASTECGRRRKASYLLQWHALQHARECGCRFYDLGGVDPEGNPGVYHFKRGLGGEPVRAIGPVELGRPGARSLIVQSAEAIHRSIRSAA